MPDPNTCIVAQPTPERPVGFVVGNRPFAEVKITRGQTMMHGPVAAPILDTFENAGGGLMMMQTRNGWGRNDGTPSEVTFVGNDGSLVALLTGSVKNYRNGGGRGILYVRDPPEGESGEGGIMKDGNDMHTKIKKVKKTEYLEETLHAAFLIRPKYSGDGAFRNGLGVYPMVNGAFAETGPIMVFKNPEGSSYVEVRNAKGEIIALGGVLRKDVKIAAGVDMTLILALTAEWELNRTWLSTGGGMR